MRVTACKESQHTLSRWYITVAQGKGLTQFYSIGRRIRIPESYCCWRFWNIVYHVDLATPVSFIAFINLLIFMYCKYWLIQCSGIFGIDLIYSCELFCIANVSYYWYFLYTVSLYVELKSSLMNDVQWSLACRYFNCFFQYFFLFSLSVLLLLHLWLCLYYRLNRV